MDDWTAGPYSYVCLMGYDHEKCTRQVKGSPCACGCHMGDRREHEPLHAAAVLVNRMDDLTSKLNTLMEQYGDLVMNNEDYSTTMINVHKAVDNVESVRDSVQDAMDNAKARIEPLEAALTLLSAAQDEVTTAREG